MEAALSDLQTSTKAQPQQGQSSQLEVPLEQLQASSSQNSDLSTTSPLPNVFQGEAGDNQQDQSQPQQSQMSMNPMSNNFNIGDVANLSYLQSNPQDQQNYLQKKFPYVIPQGQGKYLVGNSPATAKPVDVTGSSNGFFGWLASQADSIPSMIGMGAGATIGTAIEPGGGTVVGAGLGAAGGEAIAKGIGAGIGSTESLIKDGVDTVISGAFGAAGQKAVQMFGTTIGKPIANKLAQAVDNHLADIVNNGGDPGKFINFVSKAYHFASGGNAENISTLMKYGVNKSLNDRTVNNPKAIVNIAQNFIKSIQNTKTSLGQAVGASGLDLIKKAGGVDIQSSPIFNYVRQEMQAHPGWGTVDGNIITLNRNAANSADSSKFGELLKSLGASPVRTAYEAPKSSDLLRMANDQAKNLGYDVNNPTHQGLIEKTLGIKAGTIADELEKSATAGQQFTSGGPQAFKIPTNGTINVKQAIGTQQTFGQLTDKEKSPLSSDMQRVFRNVLYHDDNGNDSPLQKQLSIVASKNGVDNWLASKDAYKNFMQSLNGSAGVNTFGLDVTSPKSIQDFGYSINKSKPVDQDILDRLQNQIITPEGQPSKPLFEDIKKWSAIQDLDTHNPDFIRLGMISSLLGAGFGGGDAGARLKRGMEFGVMGGLVSPGMKRFPLKVIENMGPRGISEGLGKLLTSNKINQGAAIVGSQESAKLMRGLISKRQSQGQ